MTSNLSGAMSRQPRSLRLRILAGVAVVALTLPHASDALAGKVPLPRPSPLRTAQAGPAVNDVTDAIGQIIARDDSKEATASEDSDEAEATVAQPDVSTAPPPMPAAKNAKPVSGVGLALALKLLENNDPGAATLAAYALPDKVDIKIVDWLIASDGYAGVPSSSLASLQRKLADWPGQSLMRVRYEQALAREKPGAAAVIKALGANKPASDDGKMLLAEAYLNTGRTDDAAALIRSFWRESNFSEATEKRVFATFGKLLRASDHKTRMDRLLYAERSADGLRASLRLDKNQQALAKAVVLVIKESSKASKALDALPSSIRREALYIYSRVQVMRRAEKINEAAKLLAAASRDPKVLVSPDAWWVEQRLVSRALIEKGDARTAYALAANHAAISPTLRAEAEFHAGWYALEYLRDPALAQGHFAAIGAISTMPLSVSRAEYWMGRAAAAAGDGKSASMHYQYAARYPTTFYGQLAVARLGGGKLGISPPPSPSAEARRRFADRELVIAIRHLTTANYASKASLIYRHLAETLTDPGEIALLAGMAEASGNHQLALQIGKSAAVRGLPVEALAFPTSAIPASAKTPSVERSVVFAIARQESAFNPAAISGAGARGLLQLMPATAKETAKAIGLTYTKARLTSDAGYNATLGAAHLGSLVDDFGGSYVMTFAAYNAGASRVAQWVKLHGDPRDPKVDVVNWIEMIPFTETRNYVQRVMENLQVYRARLGSPTLVIEADLKRGGTH